MANYRIRRINEEVQKALGDILRQVKDPRVSCNFISITAVDVTGDLKYAKIYYSVIAPNCSKKELSRGLRSASGYIRLQLAKMLNLRQTPELQFIYDTSSENGAHISKLLKQVEDTLYDSDTENGDDVDDVAKDKIED